MAQVRLATTRLTSNSSTISFTGISQSYTHLELQVYAINANTAHDHQTQLTFNSNTSNYSYNFMEHIPGTNDNYGYSEPTNSASNGLVMGLGSSNSGGSSSHYGYGHIYIPFYADTAIHKHAIWRCGYVNDSTVDMFGSGCIMWGNTSAISTLTLTNSSNWLIGSTFTLLAW